MGGDVDAETGALKDDLDADTLSGGFGADTLIGGADDTLTGGEKADTFYGIKNAAEEGNAPHVTDFEVGIDKIGIIVDDSDASPDHIRFAANGDNSGVDMFYRNVKVMCFDSGTPEDFKDAAVELLAESALPGS